MDQAKQPDAHAPSPAAPGAAPASTAPGRLEALRGEGAWRLDPVRFRYLEALARRLEGQPEAVRAPLLPKLETALADYARRWQETRQQATEASVRLSSAQPRLARQARALQAAGDLRGLQRLAARAQADDAGSPLARLNAHIAAASPTLAAARELADPARHPDLSSVRRFRRSWSSSRTLDQVSRAAARRPANAGPLNAHALVVQALEQLQALSPEYLRRFLAQVESLQWLEQAREMFPAQGKGTPPKAGARAGVKVAAKKPRRKA